MPQNVEKITGHVHPVTSPLFVNAIFLRQSKHSRLMPQSVMLQKILARVIRVLVLPHVQRMGHAMEISVKIPADQKLSGSVGILEKTAPMFEVITAVKKGREYPHRTSPVNVSVKNTKGVE